MLQRHNVGMRILDQLSHDLQFSVLESLVLEDLLDRHHLPGLHQLRLVDHAEAAVTDDLVSGEDQ